MSGTSLNVAALRQHLASTEPDTAALRQHLANTNPGPAGLFDLVVRHWRDTAAAEVLCKHAEGSFPLLVAVLASLEHIMRGQHMKMAKPQMDEYYFDMVVTSLAGAQLAHATEADLLEGFRTARSGLPVGSPYLPERASHLFAVRAPLEALTDRVTAKMSWLPMEGLSPELGAGPPNSTATTIYDAECDRISWLMSATFVNRSRVPVCRPGRLYSVGSGLAPLKAQSSSKV